MVIRRDNLNVRKSDYEIQKEESGDYVSSQKTGAPQTYIFVDKSQNTTNYTVNINVTGEQVNNFDTKSGPAMKTYIFESEVSKKLLNVLDEIEEVLDDPLNFEQQLSKFLCLLEELNERRIEREVYFSDLLSMLHMGLVNIECNELNKDSISTLKDAVSTLVRKITEENLKELRSRLRNSGIDFLKPFNSDVNMKNILTEMYRDEIAT